MSYPFRNQSLPLEERVADLLSRLTTEEKIHMLSQKMNAVERLGIGEWNVGCEVARGYVNQREKGREDISTVFPQPIGMASMFDPELMYKIGEIAGNEARFYYQKHKDGQLMLWGPTVDMERDPRWGRTEEGYGEDPFLTGEMTKAYTNGLAGGHTKEGYYKTIPALKHFCCNNNEKDRDFCSADIDPRTLHEYYYAAFKPALTEGGARSVMTAYNELAGVPAIMNPALQTLLKDEWGMDFAVTDAWDFIQNVLAHRYVKTHAESLALCLKSGIDSFTDEPETVAAAAWDALGKQLITEAELDKAVGNMLKGRFMLGEFDENHPYKDMIVFPESESSRKINAEAALKQVCLLKNDGLLPLKKGVKIALIGPLAPEIYRDWYTGLSSYGVTIKEGVSNEFGAENVAFDNGYDIITLKSRKNGKYIAVDESADCMAAANAEHADKAAMFEYHEWSEDDVNLKSALNGLFLAEEDGSYKAKSQTPYAWFIKERLKAKVYDGFYSFGSWHERQFNGVAHMDMNVYTDSVGALKIKPASRLTEELQFTLETLSSGAERAAKLAKQADICIVCAGNHPMQAAREGRDRDNLALPKHQSELIKAVYNANPNTVLLLVSGYPYAVNWENEHLPAIVYTSHAGPELGSAVAKTLSGENNPAARCPLTWYKAAHQLPDIMDYDIIANDSTYMYYNGEPLYPFGHGLSYSRFAYSDFSIRTDNGGLTAKITVTNTSDKDGDEVVQIYYRPLKPRVKRPLRKLCGFKRVRVKAGESVAVEIQIPLSALEFYDATREKMCVESGEYEFLAGASCLDIRAGVTVNITGDVIPPRDMSVFVKAKNFDRRRNVGLDFSPCLNDWYAVTSVWGGSLFFDGADLRDYAYAEITACAPAKSALIELFAEGEDEPLGDVSVAPAPSKDSFTEYRLPIRKYNGVTPLEVRLNGMISVYGIRLID